MRAAGISQPMVPQGRPGVLEGMLATALRYCGSRELQISDSGV